jgi:hypothetical protein
LPVSLDCPFLIDLVLFVFVLCPVYPMLPVSLDCLFLISLSGFSNVCLNIGIVFLSRGFSINMLCLV